VTKTDLAMRRPPREKPQEPVMLTDEVARAERNPVFRGYCHMCGTAIYPGRFNWYCKSCAGWVTAH
jgi:hypothetical protein